jgi:uncharacterized protein (TIGR02270 family)
MHRVDPGAALPVAARDEHAALRARAFRVIGDRGLTPLLSLCLDGLADDDAVCAFEAARAAVLLGDRRAAPAALDAAASAAGPLRRPAMGLALHVQGMPAVHEALRRLSRDPLDARLLIQCVGIVGDPHFVPWLIERMNDLTLARPAGEAFSRITGLDLALLDLERKPPENVQAMPADDAANDAVAVDEDESLPWPEPEAIQAWWQAHGQRFASGTRYFMGEPLSSAHCLEVLRSGFQRQRQAAALYLCLLSPGTPFFNTAAPAWRQQRWLDAMEA